MCWPLVLFSETVLFLLAKCTAYHPLEMFFELARDFIAKEENSCANLQSFVTSSFELLKLFSV